MALLGSLLLYGVVKISGSYPLVMQTPELDSDSARRAKGFVKRLRYHVISEAASTTLQADIDELNGLAALVNRAIPRLKGRVNISQWELTVAYTLHLPENSFGNFINVRFGVEPSAYGLSLTQVMLGDLELSGSRALGIAEFLMNRLLGDAQGSKIVNAVQAVRIDGDQILVTFQAIPGLKNRISLLREQLADIRDDIKLFSDPDVVRLY